MTPAEYLAKQPAPVFKEGHRLPPLTRFGWQLSYEARVELAERWGYALALGTANNRLLEHLDWKASYERQILDRVQSDPERYKLAVILDRRMPEADTLPTDSWLRDAEGRYVNRKGVPLPNQAKVEGRVWSPAAPEATWSTIGESWAAKLAAVREYAPISIVLNGGEYGIGVAGHQQAAWETDPTVVDAKGDRSWYDYVSERKGAFEAIIGQVVFDAVPDLQQYIVYGIGGQSHRKRYGGWAQWDLAYKAKDRVPTLPSSEHYYRHFNSGFTGQQDILTLALNARGQEIAFGHPYTYGWLCAGWKDNQFADLSRYKGFLKCLYASGMLGGVAGYFAYPEGGFDAIFWEDAPPHWLQQMMALAEVHAEFSFYDDFLLASDLLPGPGKHRWSRDQPAYEFPSGDPAVRVLARKHRVRDEWLIVAWAADGAERMVSVEIPGLGVVEIEARPEGTVECLND